MTTEPTATPAAAMLIPPRMTPDPSPFRASTFIQPEYAKLTFLYGKSEDGSVSPTNPVHCRKFIVKIPTGAQAGALTAEPGLIRYDLTVTGGDGHDWDIFKNTTNPNEVVFTCEPPIGEVAVFDGTWQIKLELWAIEVNRGLGPVTISFQEDTSRTGNDWTVRTGTAEVSKRDDAFVFHSLRATTTVIGHNTTAQLNWEGADSEDNPNRYTMYYRNAAGVNTSVSVRGGSWTTPANEPLKQHTDFILKATFGGQDYYLTTSVEVKDPDIVATSITASGKITANGSIEVNGEPAGGAKNSYLWIRKGARLDLEESTTAGVDSAKINAYGPVTVKGLLTANGGVTAVGSISTDGTVSGANVSATSGTVTASGNISTTNGTVSGKNVSATNGTVTASGNISTTNGTVSGATVSATNVNATNVTIPAGDGKLEVSGALVAQAGRTNYHWPKVKIGNNALTLGDNNSLDVISSITSGSKQVLKDDDKIVLVNDDNSKYLGAKLGTGEKPVYANPGWYGDAQMGWRIQRRNY
ncbi:hypothetical protein ABH920_001392 [Catenulispora sp. EB89]|uniref:hypothetical protein n=1 Tax=Catenulispora sp. EB89 TaxID=3156257 RepID=UPI003515CB87